MEEEETVDSSELDNAADDDVNVRVDIDDPVNFCSENPSIK